MLPTFFFAPVRDTDETNMSTSEVGSLESQIAAQIASQVRGLLTEYLSKEAPRVPQVLFTVAEAATYLGRTVKALQHMLAEGKLPVVRDGRRVFLHRTDLDRWIEENKY